MTRTLTPAVQDETARNSRERIHLVALEFASATLRVNSSIAGVTWNANLYHGVGGVFGFRSVEESGDIGGSPLEIAFSGLDGRIMDSVLAEDYLGRRGFLWRAYLHPVTRQLLDDPILLYRGDMNGGFTIRHAPSVAGRERGTVEVTAQLTSRIARLNETNGFQTNMHSHQAIFPGDRFFEFVGFQALRPLIWKA